MKYLILFLLAFQIACKSTSGIVVDLKGTPVSGATVSADCGMKTKQTAASGRFDFRPGCKMFSKKTTVRVTYKGTTQVLSAYQIGKDREIIMPLIVNEATTKE
jgi:hypothetical protein